MEQPLFNVQELTDLRRHIHKNAEISYEEHNTSAKIREYLLSKGVDASCIKSIAKTGLVVDLAGRGKPATGGAKIVAFRADMDALEMKEENYTLPHRSVTKGAHMCFHDGHVVCLLAGATLLLQQLDKLPSNRTARLLFQPAEEKFGGAQRMVDEGCLERVAEVWGMHAYPHDPPNAVFVKPDVAYAGVRDYNITVHGRGGHSSLKKELNNPLIVVCDFQVRLNKLLAERFADTNERLFTVCFPHVHGSDSNNAIPDTATISGVFRFTDADVFASFDLAVMDLLGELEREYGVKIDVARETDYPMLVNDRQLAQALLQINEHAQTHEEVRMGADDFANLCLVVPGCYFKYYVGAQGGQTLHSPNLDFNDACIEPAARNWYAIMAARLGVHE